MIHTAKGFSMINETEVGVSLEFSWFFYDPADVDNFIFASSAFSKSSSSIWKFLVHILLKLSMKDFQHYFASMWNEWSCVAVWTFFGIAFLWDWNENQPFPVLWQLLNFQICWPIESSTFTASSFRIWNSSTGISQWYFLRPIWLHIPGCLALGEWSHHHGFLGHEDLFCIVLLCILW